ncbi:hypothetical protein SVAN01_00025 [Stagonosporopsis vannaccii]|nr:hypothetical protein SVAN01_00025 [Stagonosporopsis vannaccii]
MSTTITTTTTSTSSSAAVAASSASLTWGQVSADFAAFKDEVCCDHIMAVVSGRQPTTMLARLDDIEKWLLLSRTGTEDAANAAADLASKAIWLRRRE